jgi:hypothetical protein
VIDDERMGNDVGEEEPATVTSGIDTSGTDNVIVGDNGGGGSSLSRFRAGVVDSSWLSSIPPRAVFSFSFLAEAMLALLECRSVFARSAFSVN